MNIVFDQGTPRPLRNYLPGHTVHTLYELGWSELENGEVLDRAEADGYDLLITTDQGIWHQQELARRRISVIVLMNTNWNLVRLRAPAIAATIGRISPGQYLEIEI